jgi:chaperonin GroES
VKPLNDRVIVQRIKEEEKTKSGLYIPDTSKEKPQEGFVISVGSGKYDKGQIVPLSIKPGNRILFGKYAGTEVKIKDVEYLIIREEEILAVLEEGDIN